MKELLMKKKVITGISAIAVGSLALFSVLVASGKFHKNRPDIFPKDMEEECWNAFNHAIVNEDLSYLPKYEKCAEASNKLEEERGNYRDACASFQILGDIYFFKKDYDVAEKYYLEALEDAKKMKDTGWEATIYARLGDIYKEKGDKEKAKEYYTNAYNNYKAIGEQITAEHILDSIKQLDES